MYYWNSAGEWGDVIEWVQRRQRVDFKGAVEWLCQRAKLPAPDWSERDVQATIAARRKYDVLTVAAQYWARLLWQTPAALEYCKWRGWSDETIRRAGLGYSDGNVNALRGELQMHGVDLSSDVVRAVLATPAGMLVYPCIRGGRVTYYLTRSADRETKMHWNPPSSLVGERQIYLNWEYSPLAETVTVVEGPADAITLAQWGIPAIALAGVSPSPQVLRELTRHHVILGLNSDETGVRNTRKIADALGPLTRIVTWPAKDANQWLQDGATQDEAHKLLQEAPAWIEVMAKEVSETEGLEREQALKRIFTLAARMDDFAIAMYRPALCKALDLPIRQFNALFKAARGDQQHQTTDAEPLIHLEIPGGYIAEHLLEMIVIPPNGNGYSRGPRAGWQTRFACRFPDGRIDIIDHLDIEGIRYHPIMPSNRVLTEGIVLFPSGIGEKLSLRELVRWIQSVIRKYVDVDIFYETLAAYYVLFSWLYDSFNTVPYLRLLGDAGTGKSRFIQVVGGLCYRPTFITGAATTSPIFRILDRYRGTLILDEADYRNSDERADIIKILNTGYQRVQGVVLRSGDKNAGFEPEVFVVYGPKVIATRKRFSDWALESRCLTYETGGPTTRADIPIDLPMDFWTQEALQIRNALLRYRLDFWKPEIELDYSQMDISVEPRLNQVTVALQTLIDDEELRRDLRGFIKEYNRQLIVERGMTLTARVLEAIVGLRAIANDDGMEPEPVMTMKTIAQAVNALIDSENDGDEEDEDKRRDNKQVTPHKVGHIIRKELHLKTERSSQVGRAYVVVWDEARITALRKRFGLEDEWLTEIVKTLRQALPIAAPPPQQDELPF
jgi:uncharacterized protein (UPF0147 family)